MESYKYQRIKSLTGEVKNFHPLLRVLFSKLPNIEHVEYTQGPNEMGADFILTKQDLTLGSHEYVGCIVKIGPIKQDHGEIIRQIEECALARIINSGKDKIYLNEIWVISNDNISTNAERKIFHDFKNKNIKFISGEKITQLIENYYPEYWSDISVKVGEYLRSVAASSERYTKNNAIMDFNHKDIYIPQQLIEKKIKAGLFNKRKKSVRRQTIDSIIESNSHVLIEAMMGTGKSKLLAEQIKKYSDSDYFNSNKILPVLLSAGELYADHKSNISQVIENSRKEIGDVNIDKTIVFIDGLDEINVSWKERVSFISKIYEQTNTDNNIKIVLTSRSIDAPEHEVQIEKYFVRYQLCSLSVQQVIKLVDKICGKSEVKNKLVKDLDKSHLFKVLPKTPISAILLAKLLKENVQEIPSTMTDLYDKYMELSLGRWDMHKGLQSQQEYDVIKNVTICIAQFMFSHSLDYISIGDAKEIFNTYTMSRNLKIEKDFVFQKMLIKEDIFSIDEHISKISFRHRTFAEYFYAVGLHRDSSAIIDENVYDLFWANSYFFYIGIKRDCPALIEEIDNIVFKDDTYRILKIFNDANFLLAAYLTPYEIIKKSVNKSFQNAASLYKDTLAGSVNTPLRELSEIHVLCLLTKTLCDTYGYEYFQEALENRALEKRTNQVLAEEDYVELFFLNSVKLHLGVSSSYDTMLNDYGKDIPISLQASILEHSSSNNAHSLLLKKLDKRFHKNLKSNRHFLSKVKDIYELPLSESKKLI